MHAWWESITVFEKIFWYIAIPFSVILIIQFILIFAGMGGDEAEAEIDVPDTTGLDVPMSANFDMPPHDIIKVPEPKPNIPREANTFRLFTLRNFIAFLTIFGWVGIAGVRAHLGPVLTIIIAFILGFIAMVIFTALFYFIEKLAAVEDKNVPDIVGRLGNVMETVMANSKNIGRIHVEMPGVSIELQAITRGNEELPVNTAVKITDVVDNNVAVVEKT